MKTSRIVFIALALILPFCMSAQKRKKTVVKKPVVVVTEPEEDSRITEMREATQQIVFIDSVVVDKQDILAHIRINAEQGSILPFNQFFQTEGHADSYVFLNEMGNKCYFSNKDANGLSALFTSDKLGEDWSSPVGLKGIGNGISDANYPFMMPDGQTFYFAAKGEESIGGYDIFVTRYDSEEGKFLKPENIGMPFNSESNDYFYVIDEMSNIGYFATDRRQSKDKVCIYLFIPPSTRRTYNTSLYSEAKLRSLASIWRISDTWGNGREREKALLRLKATESMVKDSKEKKNIHFVINDKVTYTSESQFRNAESLKLFQKLAQDKKKLEETSAFLEKSRSYYEKASANDRQILRKDILNAEQQEEKLYADIKSLEKRIRATENKIINPLKNQ